MCEKEKTYFPERKILSQELAQLETQRQRRARQTAFLEAALRRDASLAAVERKQETRRANDDAQRAQQAGAYRPRSLFFFSLSLSKKSSKIPTRRDQQPPQRGTLSKASPARLQDLNLTSLKNSTSFGGSRLLLILLQTLDGPRPAPPSRASELIGRRVRRARGFSRGGHRERGSHRARPR